MKVYNVTIDPSKDTIKFTNYMSIREFLEDLNADPVTDAYGQETDSRSWERLVGSKSLHVSDVRINVEIKGVPANASYHNDWNWDHKFHCYGDNNIFLTWSAPYNGTYPFNNKLIKSPGVFENFTFFSPKLQGDWNAGDRCHSLRFKNCVITGGVTAGARAELTATQLQNWSAYIAAGSTINSLNNKCFVVGGSKLNSPTLDKRMNLGPVEFINCIFRSTATSNSDGNQKPAFNYEPGVSMTMGTGDASKGEVTGPPVYPSFNVKFIHCDLGNGRGPTSSPVGGNTSNASNKVNLNSLISLAGPGDGTGYQKSIIDIAAEEEMIDEVQSWANTHITTYYDSQGIKAFFKDIVDDDDLGGPFKLQVINCVGGNGLSEHSFNGGTTWLTTAIAGFNTTSLVNRAKSFRWDSPQDYFLPGADSTLYSWNIGGEGNLQTRYPLDDTQFDQNSGTFESFQVGHTQRGMFYNPRNYYSNQQHQPANIGPLHVSRGEEGVHTWATQSIQDFDTVRFPDHPENDVARQTWISWGSPGYQDRNVITGADKDIFGTTRSKDVLPGPIQTMSVWAEPLQLTVNSSYPVNNGFKSRTNQNFYYTLGCTNKPRGFESEISETILYMVPNENKTPVRSLTEAADTNLKFLDTSAESEFGFDMDNGLLFQEPGSFAVQVQNSALDSGVAMNMGHLQIRDNTFTQKEVFKLDFGKLDHVGTDGTPTILPSNTNYSWFVMAKTKGGPVGTNDFFFTTEPTRTIITNEPDPLAGTAAEVIEYKQVAVKRKDGDFTVFSDDASGMAIDHYVVQADSAVSALLPDASAQPSRAVTITKSTGAGNVVVVAAAGDTVHDAATYSISGAGDTVVIVSDGDNWVKLPVDYLQIERDH